MQIKLGNAQILSKYYWYFAQSNYYWKQAENLINCTGQPQFNANAIQEISIPLTFKSKS